MLVTGPVAATVLRNMLKNLRTYYITLTKYTVLVPILETSNSLLPHVTHASVSALHGRMTPAAFNSCGCWGTLVHTLRQCNNVIYIYIYKY